MPHLLHFNSLVNYPSAPPVVPHHFIGIRL